MKDLKFLIISGVFFTLTMSCAQTEKKVGPTLRTAYAEDFYIGAALGCRDKSWRKILPNLHLSGMSLVASHPRML